MAIMRGLLDPKFIKEFEKIKDLPWGEQSLYAFGGILFDRPTQDIDCAIIGPYEPQRLAMLMKRMRELGPWDVCWTADPDAVRTDGQVQKRVVLAKEMFMQPNHSSKYSWKDGLLWFYFTLPTKKQLARKEFGEPVCLIQNGAPIYL